MADSCLLQLWPEEGWPGGAWPAQSRIQLFPPALRSGHQPTPAVVIIPGGGYGLNEPQEGLPVAHFLTQHGLWAVLLYYRVAPHRFPAPFADACRAVRLVRSLAPRFNIDRQRICLLGFSAGGHLASLVATQPELYHAPQDELIGSFDARPDRLALVYPLINLEARAHALSVENLLGSTPPHALLERLSTHSSVDEATPPTLLVHAVDDEVIPAEHSLLFAAACRRRHVPCELLLCPQGGHGFILEGWSGQLAAWLSPWEEV